MPAKAGTAAKAAAEPVRPSDLSHVRVGPPFEARFSKPCIACHEVVKKGSQAAMVENTRTGKKATIHEECLMEDAGLLARRETAADLETFLA